MSTRKPDRRQFAKAIALLPLGLAERRLPGQIPLHAQTATMPVPPSEKRVPKTAAEYNRHPAIHEEEAFAAPLEFRFQRPPSRVYAMPPGAVTLHHGPLEEARAWNRSYMVRLDNDRLLHNFRVTAGLFSGAQPLGGWESPTQELRGHFVGHYLSACALLYGATGDEVIKGKADVLVEGIAECQTKLNAGGYVSAFPEELFVRLDKREKVWAPFYTLHKIMAGLLDMNQIAGNQQAFTVLVGLAGWVDQWTAKQPEDHMQAILTTEFGGMNDVLYGLAACTNDPHWGAVGDRFTKKVVFNPLAKRQDVLKGLHCNTHMPQILGAARRYELTSDYRFGEVSQFFYETVTQARTYATGGSGNTEGWLTNAGHLALEMTASSHHQECCCAYNMMKLSRHLYQWSGDARYIDYYERNLFNHRLGTIDPKTGHTSYFLSMSPAAWKTTCTEDQTFWCCTGTAVEEFSKVNDTLYFQDHTSLYVNLFVASQVEWKERGVRLQQETHFPEEPRTVLTVQSTSSEPWTLHLRVPSWTTEENQVTVNGHATELAGVPGTYLKIHRGWKAGDRVEFTMPMRLTVEPLRDDPTRQAFLYGPLVLAGQLAEAPADFDLQHNQGPEIQELPPVPVPVLKLQGRPIEAMLHPVAGQPLNFQWTADSQEIHLRPLNTLWDRYNVYWQVI